MPDPRMHRNAILIGGCLIALPALAGPAMSIQAPDPALVSSIGDTNLGTVVVGQTASVPFEITAQGLDAIALGGPPELSGPNANQFSISPGTCVDGFVAIPSATSCAATVTFRPQGAGPLSATVTVSGERRPLSLVGPICTGNNSLSRGFASSCSVSFTISGTGSVPAVPATPAPTPTVAAALTPAVRVIAARRTARVTLTASNPGTTALADVVTSMPIPKGFVITNRGGGTVSGRVISFTAPSLAVGASATYAVVLRPIGVRARKASITTTVSATGAAEATASGTITVRAAKKRVVVPVTG